MLLEIPDELLPYVKKNKKEGLVCAANIPDRLVPLFEETKEEILKLQLQRTAIGDDLLSRK